MQQVEECSQAKIDHYIDLLLDQRKLVRSSRSIIRSKHSPLARQIAKGDVKAIMRAAKESIMGTLSKEQRLNLCKMLCDFKNKIKNSTTERRREIIGWLVAAGVTIANEYCGLIIQFLWMIRQEIQHSICKCMLTGACQRGACA